MKAIWLAIGRIVILVLLGLMLNRAEQSYQEGRKNEMSPPARLELCGTIECNPSPFLRDWPDLTIGPEDRETVIFFHPPQRSSLEMTGVHSGRISHFPPPWVCEAWASWLAPSLRRCRQRRNPLRRYRLTKKQRRRLRRRLYRVLAVQPTRHSQETQGSIPTSVGATAQATETDTGGAKQDDTVSEPSTMLPRYGRQDVATKVSRTYFAEWESCLECGSALKKCAHLSWRKTIQTLVQNLLVGSRGSYCAHHPDVIYLSATAAQLSLPGSTYGLDVLVHIGYRRDYSRWTYARIHQALPSHIQVSERHLSNLYRDYLALLACADRLDVDKLQATVKRYGGLILSIDGLEPEGGQPQLWVVREVLTETLIAAGWIPRVDEDTLQDFLAPIAALNLPLLATLSDKQAALIKALNATWQDAPHQYCQAHYLSNAVDPLYKADERMKTQLRKQVRAQAGATMRQVQAQTKRQASSDGPTLIATGLAVHPPAALAQLGQDTGTDTSAHAAASSLPANVIVRQRQSSPSRSILDTPASSPPAQTSSKQSQIDELVMAYASRLRSVLSRSGRKPFRLAGLHLYADLLALLTSLDVVLTYLPDEPRLTCFADAIRQALCDFEQDYIWLAEGYSWVLDISAILDAPLPQPPPPNGETQIAQPLPDAGTAQTQLDAYLHQLQTRSDLSQPLLAFRDHLMALTRRYAPGLFHCYRIPGLPRTNNDLESLFGTVRRRTCCTAGPYHAQQLLHDYGAWLLFETIPNQQRQLERLHRVSPDDFRQERQRMHNHLQARTAHRSFRRQPCNYLARLEALAETIALLE